MTSENEKLARAFYASMSPGHRERLFGLLAAHVVYELPDGMPTGGGRFEGIADVRDRFLPNFYSALDVQVVPEEFIAEGDHVVAVGRLQGKTRETAVPIDVPFVHVWTVRDDRLERLRFFTDTATLARALGRERA
jgi:uncharacterized protein